MSLKPIKKIAGEMLLYFYALQRNNQFNLGAEVITIHASIFDGEVFTDEKSEFNKSLIKISGDANDLYNALKYLNDGSFISYRESRDSAGTNFHGIRLTSHGVDTIEGIERGKEEKNEFNINFNIKLADNVNIESLLKNELGSIIKLSKIGLL